MPDFTPQQINTALQRLQDFHTKGLNSLQIHPEPCPRGQAAVKQDAKLLGLAANLVHQARIFAGSAHGYTADEVKELCQRCQKAGMALGPNHMSRLLRIPKGEQRDRLLAELLEHQWSVHKLSRVIALDYNTRKKAGSKVGRKPRLPQTVAECYLDLKRRCNAWQRWHEAMVEQSQPTGVKKRRSTAATKRGAAEAKKGNAVWAKVSPAVKRKVAELGTAIQSLQKILSLKLKNQRRK